MTVCCWRASLKNCAIKPELKFAAPPATARVKIHRRRLFMLGFLYVNTYCVNGMCSTSTGTSTEEPEPLATTAKDNGADGDPGTTNWQPFPSPMPVFCCARKVGQGLPWASKTWASTSTPFLPLI